METIDPQEVFNIVINSNYYTEDSLYMCTALNTADLYNVITFSQMCVGCSAAMGYVKYLNEISGCSNDTLYGALEDLGYIPRKGELLAIYSDWKNRPLFLNYGE